VSCPVQIFGNKQPIKTLFRKKLRADKVRECCLSLGAEYLSSSLLPKNIKIKKERTVILPVVLYGYETWSLTLWENRRLRVKFVG